MRDRLIELIESARYWGANTSAEIADKLLSKGVIVPPCKVGDKIYALSASKTKLYLLTITHFVVCENETQIWAVGAPYASESTYICNADDLGNNEWVYLTREEAEKSLAERSGQ
jgi:hypothetical protein